MLGGKNNRNKKQQRNQKNEHPRERCTGKRRVGNACATVDSSPGGKRRSRIAGDETLAANPRAACLPAAPWGAVLVDLIPTWTSFIRQIASRPSFGGLCAVEIRGSLSERPLRRSRCWCWSGPRSEGAPVPVSRHTGSDLGALGRRGDEAGGRRDWGRGHRVRCVRRGRARRLAAAATIGGLDDLEAVVAGARDRSLGVEVCVLVQRQDIARVPVAEDVAAFAAVVSADEVAESSLAGRVVADGRLRIGLWRRGVSDGERRKITVGRVGSLPSSAFASEGQSLRETLQCSSRRPELGRLRRWSGGSACCPGR